MVVALGVDSAALLARFGVKVPLYPVKGYSATLPVTDDEKAPHAALMDESLKTAITRFGNNLRIAGTAELGNSQTTLREQALQTLMKVLARLVPARGQSDFRAFLGRSPSDDTRRRAAARRVAAWTICG